MEDITERKHLEEQLRQSQKMEAVGRLAGGVAHDFNNLLTDHLGLQRAAAGAALPEDERARAHVEEIKKAGEPRRGPDPATAGLQPQAGAGAPGAGSERRASANLDKMLRRLIGEDIELVAILGENLGRVKADPGQIEQVIMNLAVNARDAMPQGGKLTIETANVELDEAYAAHSRRRWRRAATSCWRSATPGAGMDAETQARIFEPFFTTKEKGKGTGLGLATVYGIVKQSGGYIWVYSEPGQGATFKIYLPRVEQVARARRERGQDRDRCLKGTKRSCWLRTNRPCGPWSGACWKRKGTGAGGAPAATRRWWSAELHRGPIDLLLTDVVMPGMSGRELAEHLVGAAPDMKVLYMSGYTDDAIVHHGVLGSGMAFLQKPFTPEGVATQGARSAGRGARALIRSKSSTPLRQQSRRHDAAHRVSAVPPFWGPWSAFRRWLPGSRSRIDNRVAPL